MRKMLTIPVVITLLKINALRATAEENPSIVFSGQGTNPGMPKFRPPSAVSTGRPVKANMQGTARNERAGRLV